MARKILVVDDEGVLADTIAYNLEQEGYQVIIASDGASALSAVDSEHPDLIVLDIMLPGIDGLEVCRQLRREDKTATVPIIMLTAKSDEIDKVVGLEVGADDYVTKPFGRRGTASACACPFTPSRLSQRCRRASTPTRKQPRIPAHQQS